MATEYVAIFDWVSYFKQGNDTEPVTVSRGELIVDPAEGQIERLTDKKIHPPYGAVAKKGSPLAVELSKPIRADEDPRLQRLRFDQLAGEKPSKAEKAEAASGESFSPQK